MLKRNVLDSTKTHYGETIADIHVVISVSNTTDLMADMAAGSSYAFIVKQTGITAKQGLREACETSG